MSVTPFDVLTTHYWALGLGSWASRTVLLIITGVIFGKDIGKCDGDLEGFGSASDEIVSQMQ